jgi:quinol monooxygenase YgiN
LLNQQDCLKQTQQCNRARSNTQALHRAVVSMVGSGYSYVLCVTAFGRLTLPTAIINIGEKPMVIERLEFEVIAGRVEEFLKFMQDTRGILDNSKGCRSFIYGRGVENPGKVMLLVTWESLEAHTAAKQPAEYVAWSKTFATFLGGRPAMEHFAV